MITEPTQYIHGIVLWDGSSWQQLGSGLYGYLFSKKPPGISPPVFRALVEFDGKLVVVGSFTIDGGWSVGVAFWDGAAWSHPSAQGPGGYAHGGSSLVHEGDLIVSGGFTSIGGIDANRIARLTPAGAWHPLGAGVGDDNVFHLASLDGKLYAAGTFVTAGCAASPSLAIWEGPPAPEDLNGDGVVDGLDLALLLGAWGPCNGCAADLDGNGIVNGLDLALLLSEWG